MSCTAQVIIDTTVIIYTEYYAGRRYNILGKYGLFVELFNVRIRNYRCPGVSWGVLGCPGGNQTDQDWAHQSFILKHGS